MKVDPNGTLTLDVEDIIRSLDDESKQRVRLHLGCDSDMIRIVTQQILDKWTDEGSSGASSIDAPADPVLGLDWAWREVAKRSGEVAKREIERLEDSVRYHQNVADSLRAELLNRRREY